MPLGLGEVLDDIDQGTAPIVSDPAPVSRDFAAPLTAALVLADGTVLRGTGVGAAAAVVGEVCFNTGMTGYQEVLSDPSYSGQILTFTFPHIGNVGANGEDLETVKPVVRGIVLREAVTVASNHRASADFDAWLREFGIPGITGVDTRRLTRAVRASGAPSGCLVHCPSGGIALDDAIARAREWPGLAGMELAQGVSTTRVDRWTRTRWAPGLGFGDLAEPAYRVVAVDYGAKHNILRCLASAGCAVTVVPATSSADDILRHSPDGVFLSNGPGDPAATGEYAVPSIRGVLKAGVPVMGVCLGHQILALAVGAATTKMWQGHRGANHPVRDLATGRVEITSQNHGFVVDPDSLPATAEVTHVSLFDGTLEGMRLTDHPAFSVQYHPEASPGPQDSHYLFGRFIEMIEASR